MDETEAIAELQSEIEALQGQLTSLHDEKTFLLKESRVEDCQVKNWKWIHDATKFSGVSVNRCSEKSCTFHFHAMFGNQFAPTYAMTVNLRDRGNSTEPRNGLSSCLEFIHVFVNVIRIYSGPVLPPGIDPDGGFE